MDTILMFGTAQAVLTRGVSYFTVIMYIFSHNNNNNNNINNNSHLSLPTNIIITVFR